MAHKTNCSFELSHSWSRLVRLQAVKTTTLCTRNLDGLWEIL